MLCASAQINVREKPYRARGDGKTDDTAAFQKALDAAAAAGGGIVFAPAGRYLIRTHLTIPANTTLSGVGRAPQAYDPKEPRTTLLAVEGAGNADGTPFITMMGPNATLEGITVFYPEQKIDYQPVAYPWTVRNAEKADNISLVNVLLVNPYRGVDLGGETPAARHYIRGLYGQPLSVGLLVDQCYDIGRIKEVHFWPFWTGDQKIVQYTTTNGTGFIFKRTDWEVVEDIFVWGYRTGVQLTASKHGAMNGQMSNINLDNVDIGVDVDETQPYAVHFSNLNIANAGAGLRHIAVWGHGDKPAEVTIRGASFWGELNQAVKWENPGTLSIGDSRIVEWNIRKKQPAMIFNRGKVILHDSFFSFRKKQVGIAVQVNPDVSQVLMHHNLMSGHTVENRAGAALLEEGNR